MTRTLDWVALLGRAVLAVCRSAGELTLFGLAGLHALSGAGNAGAAVVSL